MHTKNHIVLLLELHHIICIENKIRGTKQGADLMFLFIFLFIAGILIILKPNILWILTESWKSNGTEPSELYLWSTRLGGIICFVIGLAGTIALNFI